MTPRRALEEIKRRLWKLRTTPTKTPTEPLRPGVRIRRRKP